jgi:dTMP kinase
MRKRREEEGGKPDRFEREDPELHDKRRTAFIDIALAEPRRCVVIDADRPADAIGEEIWQVVSRRFLSRAA